MKPRSPMVRLLRYAAPYRGKIILALVAMGCYSMVNALLPFGTITAANTVMKKYAPKEAVKAESAEKVEAGAGKVERPTGRKTLDVIWSFSRSVLNTERWKPIYLGVVIALIFILRGIFAFFQEFLTEWVSKRVVTDLRDQLYGHFHTLSVGFFSGAKTGELMSRITNDIHVAEMAFSRALADIFLQPLSILFMLGSLTLLSWKLTLFTLVGFPLIFIPLLGLGKKVRKNMRKIQAFLANLTAIVQETISGIRVVRAFGMEKYETDKFARENRRVFEASIKVVRAFAAIHPLLEFVGGVSAAVVLVMGAELFDMELPTLLGFCTGVFMLYVPAKKLGQVNTRLQMGTAAAERVFSILDTPPDIVDSPGAMELPRMRERLAYDGVNFRYDEELVLKDVTFAVSRGQVVAFVGPSGSGKTTIVNLLLRFYDPLSGSIAIDGVDIRGAKVSSLRGQMAIVSQEVILFNDTISANIAYGRPDTPFSEIVEAAKAANADGFIASLPDGYDTLVGERGIKLSGGERQRIAIARAILKDPAILILDEATSALDTESERLVQSAIHELMRGRTVLVIAHRLSTVMSADTILVLENGRVVQKGSHRELIEQEGLYRKLYDMQFQDV